jgi:hypothetical protein
MVVIDSQLSRWLGQSQGGHTMTTRASARYKMTNTYILMLNMLEELQLSVRSLGQYWS